MFLTPAILKADFVRGGRADHVAGIVAVCDQIRMAAVMHDVRDIRPVRVAAFKGDCHLRPVQQREVKPKHIPAVRSAQTHQRTFKAVTFFIKVKIKLHAVAALRIDSGIRGIAINGRHAAGHGSGYHRTRQIVRTVAVAVQIGMPFRMAR